MQKGRNWGKRAARLCLRNPILRRFAVQRGWVRLGVYEAMEAFVTILAMEC